MTEEKRVIEPLVDSDLAMKQVQEKQQIMLQALSESYMMKLEEEMGKLHNQFVVFISASKIPLPQVLLVLEMLKKETIDQAFKKYLGE